MNNFSISESGFKGQAQKEKKENKSDNKEIVFGEVFLPESEFSLTNCPP